MLIAVQRRETATTATRSRFVPIVRTFVPFVAGIGSMSYPRFIAYNVIGGFIWIYFFTYAGFWFGNQPFVQKNFKLVILGIIFVSILPGVFEFWRERRRLRELSARERRPASPG